MSTADRTLLAAGGIAVLVAIVAAWLILAPSEPADDASLLVPSASGVAAAAEPHAQTGGNGADTTSTDEIVVDVEGGVMRPGVQRLAAGSRVADALAAAGGYSPSADLIAASRINLAQPLTDGEQVLVPVLGASTADAGGDGATDVEGSVAGGASGDGGRGLVDLNTATPEELEALPGIGPVTVQKIVAARQERPFASLDEAVERDVIDRGQLEQIRDLATAG